MNAHEAFGGLVRPSELSSNPTQKLSVPESMLCVGEPAADLDNVPDGASAKLLNMARVRSQNACCPLGNRRRGRLLRRCLACFHFGKSAGAIRQGRRASGALLSGNGRRTSIRADELDCGTFCGTARPLSGRFLRFLRSLRSAGSPYFMGSCWCRVRGSNPRPAVYKTILPSFTMFHGLPLSFKKARQTWLTRH